MTLKTRDIDKTDDPLQAAQSLTLDAAGIKAIVPAVLNNTGHAFSIESLINYISALPSNYIGAFDTLPDASRYAEGVIVLVNGVFYKNYLTPEANVLAGTIGENIQGNYGERGVRYGLGTWTSNPDLEVGWIVVDEEDGRGGNPDTYTFLLAVRQSTYRTAKGSNEATGDQLTVEITVGETTQSVVATIKDGSQRIHSRNSGPLSGIAYLEFEATVANTNLLWASAVGTAVSFKIKRSGTDFITHPANYKHWNVYPLVDSEGIDLLRDITIGKAFPESRPRGVLHLFDERATGLTATFNTDGTTPKTFARSLDLFESTGESWRYLGNIANTSLLALPALPTAADYENGVIVLTEGKFYQKVAAITANVFSGIIGAWTDGTEINRGIGHWNGGYGQWTSNPDEALAYLTIENQENVLSFAIDRAAYRKAKGSNEASGDTLDLAITVDGTTQTTQVTIIDGGTYTDNEKTYLTFFANSNANNILLTSDVKDVFTLTVSQGGSIFLTHTAGADHWVRYRVSETRTDGDSNVQSDWNETDPESDAFIKDKPPVRAIGDFDPAPDPEDYDENDVILIEGERHVRRTTSSTTEDLFVGTTGVARQIIEGVQWRGVVGRDGINGFTQRGTFRANPDNAIAYIMASTDNRLQIAVRLDRYETVKGSAVAANDELKLKFNIAGSTNTTTVEYIDTQTDPTDSTKKYAVFEMTGGNIHPFFSALGGTVWTLLIHKTDDSAFFTHTTSTAHWVEQLSEEDLDQQSNIDLEARRIKQLQLAAADIILGVHTATGWGNVNSNGIDGGLATIPTSVTLQKAKDATYSAPSINANGGFVVTRVPAGSARGSYHTRGDDGFEIPVSYMRVIGSDNDWDYYEEPVRQFGTVTLRSNSRTTGQNTWNGKVGDEAGVVHSDEVGRLKRLTQAEYDGLSAKDNKNLYVIDETGNTPVIAGVRSSGGGNGSDDGGTVIRPVLIHTFTWTNSRVNITHTDTALTDHNYLIFEGLVGPDATPSFSGFAAFKTSELIANGGIEEFASNNRITFSLTAGGVLTLSNLGATENYGVLRVWGSAYPIGGSVKGVDEEPTANSPYALFTIDANQDIPGESAVAGALDFTETPIRSHNATDLITRDGTDAHKITLAAGTYIFTVHLAITATYSTATNSRSSYTIVLHDGTSALDTVEDVGYVRGAGNLDLQTIDTHHIITLASETDLEVRVKVSDAGQSFTSADTAAGGRITIRMVGTAVDVGLQQSELDLLNKRVDQLRLATSDIILGVHTETGWGNVDSSGANGGLTVLQTSPTLNAAKAASYSAPTVNGANGFVITRLPAGSARGSYRTQTEEGFLIPVGYMRLLGSDDDWDYYEEPVRQTGPVTLQSNSRTIGQNEWNGLLGTGQPSNTAVHSGGIRNIVKLTQAEYTALATKDDSTLYVIVG